MTEQNVINNISEACFIRIRASFDESTQLCGSMLITPVIFDEEEYVCTLSEDEEVNFYQIIPLYREEMDFKMQHGADDLLKQMDGRVLVVDPKRQKFSPEILLS